MICLVKKDKLINFELGASPLIINYRFENYDDCRDQLNYKELARIFKIVREKNRNVILRTYFVNNNITFDSLITPEIIKQNYQIKI